MATLNGANYAKSVASPKAKIENGEQFGKVHMLREQYDLDDAGVVIALNDVILGPKIPKGARVLSAEVKISASMGTGGIFDLGYLVSDDAVEAADLDAFVQQADAGGQAVLQRHALGAAGIDKKFAAEVQTQLKCTEATTNITGVISWWITYVIN